jgi:cytochrome c biogenesis protein CcdA
LGAKEQVSFMTLLVTLAFSIGASVPLLVIALAGSALVETSTLTLRQHGPLLRRDWRRRLDRDGDRHQFQPVQLPAD